VARHDRGHGVDDGLREPLGPWDAQTLVAPYGRAAAELVRELAGVAHARGVRLAPDLRASRAPSETAPSEFLLKAPS
jgi:hypothetical protein